MKEPGESSVQSCLHLLKGKTSVWSFPLPRQARHTVCYTNQLMCEKGIPSPHEPGFNQILPSMLKLCRAAQTCVSR